MSVVSSNYMRDRDGDFTGVGGVITRVLVIIVDSRSDNEQTIIDTFGVIPPYMSRLAQNIFYTLRQVRLEADTQAPLKWLATLTYKAGDSTDEERDKVEPNPLLRRAIIQWGSNEYTEPLDRDIDGQGILSSADESYDPAAERQATHDMIHVTKNVVGVPNWYFSHRNSVNESEWTVDGITVPTGHGRMARRSLSEWKEENGIRFRTLDYEVDVMDEPFNLDGQVLDRQSLDPVTPEGHDLVILDRGLREKVFVDDNGNPINEDGSPEWVNILDPRTGEPVTSPYPLDATGLKHPSPSPDTVFYFRHRRYHKRDWSVLPVT